MKKLLLLLIVSNFAISASRCHYKEQEITFYNQTNYPFACTFRIERETKKASPSVQYQGFPIKAKLPDHKDACSKINLPEFYWFESKGMGLGKNKVVQALMHGFPNTCELISPSCSDTPIIKSLDPAAKEHTITIEENDITHEIIATVKSDL